MSTEATCYASPALRFQSDYYPSAWHRKVPKKVKMTKTVRSDLPIPPFLSAPVDHEYFVWVNSHGAISAIFEDGKQLGLKPCEFEIIEWHHEVVTYTRYKNDLEA